LPLLFDLSGALAPPFDERTTPLRVTGLASSDTTVSDVSPNTQSYVREVTPSAYGVRFAVGPSGDTLGARDPGKLAAMISDDVARDRRADGQPVRQE
jgi:hypothetical protein